MCTFTLGKVRGRKVRGRNLWDRPQIHIIQKLHTKTKNSLSCTEIQNASLGLFLITEEGSKINSSLYITFSYHNEVYIYIPCCDSFNKSTAFDIDE